MSKPFLPGDHIVDSADSVHEAVEAERVRLAQDLHDDLGGRLIAVKMALAPLLQAGSSQQTAARRADQLLDEAIAAMFDALHRLRPRELDLGLVAALQQIADDFSSPALVCRFSSNQPEIDAAPALMLGLMRICREALANVAKYAHAGQVDIRLSQVASDTDRGALLLDIIDNGGGYPEDAPDSASIAHRVRSLGGILERRAWLDDGVGCHLHIRVPMAPCTNGNS
jgi:two-component system sensor histidine kinase UhpB